MKSRFVIIECADYIVGYKAKGHKCSYALFEIFRSEDTANQGLPSYKVW